MSGMFWIALELSIQKIGFNIMLSLTVKELDAVRFDEVAESDNTGGVPSSCTNFWVRQNRRTRIRFCGT